MSTRLMCENGFSCRREEEKERVWKKSGVDRPLVRKLNKQQLLTPAFTLDVQLNRVCRRRRKVSLFSAQENFPPCFLFPWQLSGDLRWPWSTGEGLRWVCNLAQVSGLFLQVTLLRSMISLGDKDVSVWIELYERTWTGLSLWSDVHFSHALIFVKCDICI